MSMTTMQQVAFDHPCLLACENLHPRYTRLLFGNKLSVMLTLQRSWEVMVELDTTRPLWHCSAASLHMTDADLRRHARLYLAGVGLFDPFGKVTDVEQFTDGKGVRTFHLRRFVSDAELAMLGPCVDIRGTDEARRRFEQLRSQVPPHMAHLLVTPE